MKNPIWTLLAIFITWMPVAAQDSTSRTVDVLEAKYQIWCVGDIRKAEEALGHIDARPSVEECLVVADLDLCRDRRSTAVEFLATQALGRDPVAAGPLLRRLHSLDPRLRLAYREGDTWWISGTRLFELQQQGLAIKEGVLFERRVDLEDPEKLLSYRLHTLQGRGQVLNEFGFVQGDDILRIDGTPVSDWGFQEAFSLAAGMASGMDLEIVVVPAGSERAITRTYRFRSDAEVIARHLKLEIPGKD